jgi:hypothetical protein
MARWVTTMATVRIDVSISTYMSRMITDLSAFIPPPFDP